MRACIIGNSCLENDWPDEKLRISLGAVVLALLIIQVAGETQQQYKQTSVRVRVISISLC